MKVELKKKAEKYLASLDLKKRSKLEDEIKKLETFSGDIVRLEGQENMWRLKTYHYRVIFYFDQPSELITVIKIGPRGDVYK